MISLRGVPSAEQQEKDSIGKTLVALICQEVVFLVQETLLCPDRSSNPLKNRWAVYGLVRD